MTANAQPVVSHQVIRLRIEVKQSFDDFRHRYERAVPAIDGVALANWVTKKAPWQDVEAETQASAPYGFLRYWEADVSSLMSLAGHRARCVQYLMGNHTIAERMFRHDPSVMLYAPLRAALIHEPGGQPFFLIDRPSTQFASFGSADIARVGTELDEKLSELLSALGCRAPDLLCSR